MAGATVGDDSYVSCVKRITSGSKVTIVIPRNNLSYSAGLLDDVSVKSYVDGYASNVLNISDASTSSAPVVVNWSNSSLNSYYPTIAYSNTSRTVTVTLTATFSTTKFLVIRYCPGLTTITVS